MKKEMTVTVVGAVAGAVVGAITTALLGMVQIVSPLKEDLEITISEKNVLEGQLKKYMYGETIKTAKKDNLLFEVANINHTDYESLLVKILVSNLTDETRPFYVNKKNTSIQTETTDVYGVKQLSVLTTGMLDQDSVGMPIPSKAKHVPISIEVAIINPDSKFLTSFNLSFSNNPHGRSEQLVVFNDLPIPAK